jgi:hypothetical protein
VKDEQSMGLVRSSTGVYEAFYGGCFCILVHVPYFDEYYYLAIVVPAPPPKDGCL